MQADPNDLRQHYRSLSDDELLGVDRSDLVPMAQKLYDAEIARRELAPSSLASKPEPPRPVADAQGGPVRKPLPTSKDEKPAWLDNAVEVYSAYADRGTDSMDVTTRFRDVLEAAGLPCHVELVPTEPLPPAPPFTWRILVPRDLYLQADSTLERDIRNKEFDAVWKNQIEGLPDSELLASPPEVVFCGLFDRVVRLKRAYETEVARRQLNSNVPQSTVIPA